MTRLTRTAFIAALVTLTSASVPAHAGGGGAGKVKFDRLTIKKYSDTATTGVPASTATMTTGN